MIHIICKDREKNSNVFIVRNEGKNRTRHDSAVNNIYSSSLEETSWKLNSQFSYMYKCK